MNRLLVPFAIFVVALASLMSGFTAHAADYCYCEPKDFNQLVANKTIDTYPPVCQELGAINAAQCPTGAADIGLDAQIYTCSLRDTNEQCQASKNEWNQRVVGEQGRTTLVGSVIPSCLFDTVLSPRCRDISIFVELLINIGNWLFTIIGALALAAFVYGGFMLILSSGNPEKIKKGTDAMLAAVIGLAIAFGGYLLVRFLGQAVGVDARFQLTI